MEATGREVLFSTFISFPTSFFFFFNAEYRRLRGMIMILTLLKPYITCTRFGSINPDKSSERTEVKGTASGSPESKTLRA